MISGTSFLFRLTITVARSFFGEAARELGKDGFSHVRDWEELLLGGTTRWFGYCTAWWTT